MTMPGTMRRAVNPVASRALLFGREWLRAPRAVGAVAPSSRALARAITDGLSNADAPVLELGPGTGVFTRALLARGIAVNRIAAIEANARFAAALAGALPGLQVIAGDAARLRRLTPFGPASAGTVICGLPLLTIPKPKILRIVAGGFAALRPGGAFRLFTYGPTCPVPGTLLGRLGLVAQRTAFIAGNIPPASVYVLRRSEDGL